MRIFMCLGALALVVLPGCDMIEELMGGGDGGGGSATPAATTPGPAAAPAPNAAKAAEKKPEASPEELYVYNPIGKRDPFRTFLTKEGDEDDDSTRKTPLQKYDIDQYELVGIIWGIERPRALVQDPTGEGYVMEIGTYIGKNWGKVTQIQSDVVVVTEEYEAVDGRLIVNPIHLKLPVEEEKN